LALSNRHILTTADFVFRCPATGFNVQHELDDDQEFSEDEDEAITCLATERLESALRNFVGFAAVLADLDDLLGNDLRLTCASLIFRQIEGATGRFLLQQMVAVAELEAGMISTRTKAALAATKARGNGCISLTERPASC
jgi:Resolvase, N terminal domain